MLTKVTESSYIALQYYAWGLWYFLSIIVSVITQNDGFNYDI